MITNIFSKRRTLQLFLYYVLGFFFTMNPSSDYSNCSEEPAVIFTSLQDLTLSPNFTYITSAYINGGCNLHGSSIG